MVVSTSIIVISKYIIIYWTFLFCSSYQQYKDSHNAHWTQIAMTLISAYEAIVWKHVRWMCVEWMLSAVLMVIVQYAHAHQDMKATHTLNVLKVQNCILNIIIIMLLTLSMSLSSLILERWHYLHPQPWYNWFSELC